MKTTLTIEQSQKLIELGVDAKLASADHVGRWEHYSNGCYPDPDSVSPLFTLTDLLSILPKKIKIHRDGDNLSMIYHCGKWRVGYTNCAEYCDHTKAAPELIDALNQLAIWAIEQGHLKTEKK